MRCVRGPRNKTIDKYLRFLISVWEDIHVKNVNIEEIDLSVKMKELRIPKMARALFMPTILKPTRPTMQDAYDIWNARQERAYEQRNQKTLQNNQKPMLFDKQDMDNYLDNIKRDILDSIPDSIILDEVKKRKLTKLVLADIWK